MIEEFAREQRRKQKLNKLILAEPYKIAPASDKIGIGAQVMSVKGKVVGITIDKRYVQPAPGYPFYVQYLVSWVGVDEKREETWLNPELSRHYGYEWSAP